MSNDGLAWELEPGIRLGDGLRTYGTPRCLPIMSPSAKTGDEVWWRLYCHHYAWPMQDGLGAQNHIVSAISADGLNFQLEPGVRIPQQGPLQDYAVYAPEVLRLGDGKYRMYYAGWSQKPLRGRIFSARSVDGIDWECHANPCLSFGGPYAELKVSEPCIIGLHDGRCRMFYEASDSYGNWRIFSATSG